MNTEYHLNEDKDITLTPILFLRQFGAFDLDPCGISSHPTAATIFSLPVDGLKVPWAGRVWLNPPYSAPKEWLKKLSEHGNGLALVLNSTDTEWFQEFGLKRADGMFLLKGRPKFTRLDGSRVSIMRGVVLFAYGKHNVENLRNSGVDGVLLPLFTER